MGKLWSLRLREIIRRKALFKCNVFFSFGNSFTEHLSVFCMIIVAGSSAKLLQRKEELIFSPNVLSFGLQISFPMSSSNDTLLLAFYPIHHGTFANNSISSLAINIIKHRIRKLSPKRSNTNTILPPSYLHLINPHTNTSTHSLCLTQ